MKTKTKKITTFSLFCGLGGEHLGKTLAFKDVGIYDNCQFWALNHWQIAVDTLQRNFPHSLTYCEDIEEIDVSEIGIKTIDLLWASPSCVYHSIARNKKPINEMEIAHAEQQRSHVLEVYKRWLCKCHVPIFLMENVPKFLTWGPRDEFGNVIKSRKGEYFRDFVKKLENLDYKVGWKILNASDYGDPTTRKRLFLQAVKDGQGIHWPEPTHRNPNIPGNLPVWKSAADYVIDWTISGESIYYRKIPLVPKTINRIKHGLKKFGLTPYFAVYHGSINETPRILSVNLPISTLDCSNRFGLVQPVIIKGYGGYCTNPASGINSPLPTVTTVDHNYLLQPFLFNQIKTVVAKNNMGVIRPFIITYHGTSKSHSITEPIPTVLRNQHHALTELVVKKEGNIENLPVIRTPDDINNHDFKRPFCIEYSGQKYLVDITLRMLEPRELARAMGFPESFRFEKLDGSPLTKSDSVRMIGNACPVNTVRELVKTVINARKKEFKIK